MRQLRQSPKPWTPDEIALLEKLAADKVDRHEMARQCGHSAGSCLSTLSLLRRRRREAAKTGANVSLGKGDIKNPRRFWTEADVQTLIRLRNVEGKLFSEIDRELGRAEGASCTKFQGLRRPSAVAANTEVIGYQTPKPLVPHSTLTAAVLGDPLPGRSALDRKREGALP